MADMPKIKIGRYDVSNTLPGSVWAGWIEPESKTWVLFIKRDGTPVFFPNRDPATGAVLPEG